MNAIDFANYFEFDIVCEGSCLNNDDMGKYTLVDRDGVVSDKNLRGIFDITIKLEGLYEDQIDDLLIENGFMFNDKIKTGFYEQALDWIESTYMRDSAIYDVVKVLAGKDKLTLL